MPILSGCCFCFDLKVGTKIIGGLSLFAALMNSLMFGILLAVLSLFQAGGQAVIDSPTGSSGFNDYEDVTEEQKEVVEVMMSHIDTVKLALFVMLGVSLLFVITSSMLIHGVRKNRRGLLLPYIVQEFLNIVVYIGLIITVLVILGGQHTIIWSSVLGVVGGILVHLYFMLVVISQYQALGLIRMHEEISMK